MKSVLKWVITVVTGCIAIGGVAQPKPSTESVYFTNGFKIGDLTPTSVVIWTRLCDVEQPVAITHERIDRVFRSPKKFDNNTPVEQMDGHVKGSYGEVMIELHTIRNQRLSSGWQPVSGLMDFTYKHPFEGLLPATKYTVTISGRKDIGSPISTIQGSFTTAPKPNQTVPITFTSSSCQYFWDYDDEQRGFKIYDAMAKLKPAFFSQTGDYVYYDKGGPFVNTIDAAYHKWSANNGWSAIREFLMTTPIYMQKDDHDTLRDDASPGSRPMKDMTFKDGVEIWRAMTPIKDRPYNNFRWGRDLEVWVVEGREYRDDNWIDDNDKKTILGEEQKRWLKQSIESSDATFKVLLSNTPVVGPDRPTKRDNHANPPFVHEGDWLRSLLGKHSVYVINGDRHWQYVSVDKKSGVMEFSQGPASDSHAGGWGEDEKMAEHKFLLVKGGFLSVTVDRVDGKPTIWFRHHDVDGNVVNEEIITRKK
ncbi:MAG: alkaline phosphatase D family protein [Rikenellaceae bacterium]